MNGQKIREARLDQKKITAERRISQTTLTDDQARTVLFAFLRDMKQGNLFGVIGIIMLQSGHRPIEAGATTLGMHCPPDGESFLSAWVYEVINGNIVDNHKTHRSRRLIPDGPILGTVYHYVLQQMIDAISSHNSNLNWRKVPFGGQPIIKNGQLVDVKPFSSKDVSCYVRRKLEENGITFRVAVDCPEEDSDDNRRAYILRYTAATNLFCFLRRDLYQYVMAHRRSTSASVPEDDKESPEYYSAPQTQRIIYQGIKERDEAVYGTHIVEEIKRFLEFDDSNL